MHGQKNLGRLVQGGLSGGGVRIIAGLSKGLSGPRRLASTFTCHNHIYNQKHGAAKEAQPEMSFHFLISPPVRSSSLVSPFRFRSRALLQCSFQNSCADWGHVAVEDSSGQGTSAQRHPPTSGVVWPVSPDTSSQLWVQRCCATFSSQFCLTASQWSEPFLLRHRQTPCERWFGQFCLRRPRISGLGDAACAASVA